MKRYDKYLKGFGRRLQEINEVGLKLYEKLDLTDKKIITELYGNGDLREHYWTLAKLFILGSYLPMALRIARKHFNQGVVYIDGYSGPGLNKIGKEEKDVVIGSPLVSILVPFYVNNYRSPKSYLQFFDTYYFNDITREHIRVLRKIIKIVREDFQDQLNVKFYAMDFNDFIDTILSSEHLSFGILFLDPFGSLEQQPSLKFMYEMESADKIKDVLYPIFISNIARGLSVKKSDDIEEWVEENGIWLQTLQLYRGSKNAFLAFSIEKPPKLKVSADWVSHKAYRLGLIPPKYVRKYVGGYKYPRSKFKFL